MWTCLKQKNKTLQLRLSNAGKTEPQWCSQRKCLGITSHMNHCPTCWDIECDVKRFTHHYVAQRKPLSHCFQSVLLWMFRKLIFKLCNGVFSHLISKTNCNWFISKLAEKMGKAECRTQQRVMFITDCVCVCVFKHSWHIDAFDNILATHSLSRASYGMQNDFFETYHSTKIKTAM